MMEYFHKFFPEQAAEDIVVLDTSNNDSLPDNAYRLFDFCCANPECDCRKILIHIEPQISINSINMDSYDDPVAILSYSLSDPISATNPCFFDQIEQSPYAPILLSLVFDYMNTHPDYIDQLHKHYAMLKEAGKDMDFSPIEFPSIFTPPMQPIRREFKIGRNELCPCGSGKKYKKCCLLKDGE